MERFCEPNLPSSRVRSAFISSILPDAIVNELNDYGIETFKLGKSKNLPGELAYHPDLLINNFRKGHWVYEEDADYIPREMPGFDKKSFHENNIQLGKIYPYDCLFNCFRIHNTVICGKKVADFIKFNIQYEGLDVIYVPQGYAKCSTVLVSSDAAITCDRSIYKALRSLYVDVLLLPNNEGVSLNGYSCGFLGGCATLLDKNLLAFTGNLNTYKYGGNITDFCKNHGVDVFSLTNESMYDYGGILPLTEMVPSDEIV